MKQTKKLLCAILALVMVLALAACGKAEPDASGEPVASTKDTITIPVAVNVGDMNAHLYADDMMSQAIVYEGLVAYSPDGIEPALAESWDISDDGTVYTFHLRKGVTFTDGEPFNAEAVKLNIDAIQSNKERHSWIVLCNKIVSCDVVDEYTVNLVLSDPYYPTLTELSLIRPYRFMSPKCFIDGETKNGVKDPAGTGAYYLEENVIDQYATFKANENYWGGAPAIKTVTLKMMPSGETTLMAFKNGELNLLFGTYFTAMIDTDSVLDLEKDSNFQVIYSEPIATRYFVTNSLPERPIADINVKEAVWYAIDRQSLCDYVFSGLEAPAETLFGKNMPYCDVDLKARGFDTEKAKACVEKSGWVMDDASGYYTKDGQPLTLQILYNSSLSTNKTICEFIQSNLKDAGIYSELVPADAATVYDARDTGAYDLFLDASWGLPYDPQSTITGLYSNGSYKSAADQYDWYAGLCDNIESALISTDEAERQGYFDKILGTLHDECVFIPLSYSTAYIAAPADLQGIQFGQSQYDLPFYTLSFK